MLDDLRSALRQIWRNPGFAAATILTLALGVGATTAVFTLADPMLFRPLPYPDAAQLVTVHVTRDTSRGDFLHVPDYVRLEANHASFEGVANFHLLAVSRLPGRAENIIGYGVTPEFLQTLRVTPILGRGFLPGEHRPGIQPERVALITYALWQSHYGASRDVIGRTLDLQGSRLERYQVVGVLGPEFVFPDHVNQPPAFLLPSAVDPNESRQSRFAHAIARLAPGVTITAAAAEVQAIVSSVEHEYPSYPQGRRVRLVPLQEALFGRVRTPLLMLLTATGCVLLLACANLAHLFLARLHARRREIGIRLAIGSGPWRLARLLIVEAALLAVAGAGAALALGQWVFDLIMARTPEFAHVYRILPASLDWRVALFGTLLAAIALMIFGLVPALRASRADVRESLGPGGRGGNRGSVRADAALILIQSAVAVALLVTGTLIVRSFVRLAFQPLGFEPEYVRTVQIEIGDGQDTVPARYELYRRLRERLPLPVALAGGLPGQTLWGGVTRVDAPADAQVSVVAYPGTDTFFDTFGVRLMRGRLFDEHEAFSNAPVAVIDERAAARLWAGGEPLGRQIRQNDGAVRTVIGIVQTLRTHLAAEDEPGGSAFVPIAAVSRSPTVAVRIAAAEVPFEEIRTVIRESRPDAAVTVRAFQPFERTLGQPRFLAAILGTLGMLTIALTVVGIFGVVNHEVTRRTREVGVRMALGADASRIRRMVLRGVLVPAVAGIAVGGGAALLWTRTLRSVLFGLQPNDPVSFLTSASLVVALVAIASLMPAWRASHVEPTVALRSE